MSFLTKNFLPHLAQQLKNNFLLFCIFLFTNSFVLAQNATPQEEIQPSSLQKKEKNFNTDEKEKQNEKKEKTNNSQNKKITSRTKTLLIEVTSNKRKENIQNIPAAISAFSKEQIEDQKIETVDDVSRAVPNYQTGVYNPGFVFHAIRGQSNVTQASSPIGIYVDDVPLTASQNMSTNNPDLFALERIEVLRGPQGNLYGLNSAAGIINIITRKPSNTWEGKASLTIGNYALRKYNAYVSGAIVKDKLFVSLAGMYKKQEAYLKEKGADPYQEMRDALRLQLLYSPLQNLQITFTAQMSNAFQDYMPFTTVGKYDDPYLLPTKYSGEEEYWKSINVLSDLHIKYQHEKFDLISVTSFQYSNSKSLQDLTIFFTPPMPSVIPKFKSTQFNSPTWTQEIRFISNQDTPLKWLGGIFYSNSKLKYNSYTSKFVENIKSNDFALFGQIVYTFFNKLTLGLGLRYDMDHKTLDYNGLSHSKPKKDIRFDDTNIHHSASPKFTIDYRVHKSILVYASISQGVQAGGYNRVSKDKNSAHSFKPEYNWTTELGLKTNFYQDKILLNVNGFYTYMKDAQVFYSTTPGSYIYDNAPKAHSAGTELEFLARPVQGLEISASFGYLFSEFIEHKQAFKEKNKLPFSPLYQADIFLQYITPWGIYLGMGANFVGNTFFDDYNAERQRDYMLLKAKIGYMSNHFSVDLWIDNMLNQVYYGYRAVLGKPRTFGMQITAQF